MSRKALRVELEAPVCSFRYPHFLIGRQLSFDMPPPATVFGLVAAALGDWPDPRAFRFAYHFEATAKGEDLEHQHIVFPSGGQFEIDGTAHGKVVQASVQPTRREFLFHARLTLYVDRPDLEEAFREPRFPVVLGRSQDLGCVSRVEHVLLERAERGYFEGTLLPAAFRRRTGRGTTVLMPGYVGPPPLREATFTSLIVLRDAVYWGPREEGDRFGSRQMLHIEGEPLEVWVDPDSPEKQDRRRAVWFHAFAPET